MSTEDPDVRVRKLEQRREWRQKNPEKVLAQRRAFIARRREKAPALKAQREAADASYRQAHLVKKFKMSSLEYDALFASQGGRCAICFRRESVVIHGSRIRLAVDHCHATGKTRGLLCQACNTALGKADDSPERLEAMASYLRGAVRVRRLGCGVDNPVPADLVSACND